MIRYVTIFADSILLEQLEKTVRRSYLLAELGHHQRLLQLLPFRGNEAPSGTARSREAPAFACATLILLNLPIPQQFCTLVGLGGAAGFRSRELYSEEQAGSA